MNTENGHFWNLSLDTKMSINWFITARFLAMKSILKWAGWPVVFTLSINISLIVFKCAHPTFPFHYTQQETFFSNHISKMIIMIIIPFTCSEPFKQTMNEKKVYLYEHTVILCTRINVCCHKTKHNSNTIELKWIWMIK